MSVCAQGGVLSRRGGFGLRETQNVILSTPGHGGQGEPVSPSGLWPLDSTAPVCHPAWPKPCDSSADQGRRSSAGSSSAARPRGGLPGPPLIQEQDPRLEILPRPQTPRLGPLRTGRGCGEKPQAGSITMCMGLPVASTVLTPGHRGAPASGHLHLHDLTSATKSLGALN